MNLPTREESLRIMYEAGCSQQVINHCISVTEVALRIVQSFNRRGFDVDSDLVEVGAILHDLGRSKTHSVEHGVIGGRLAREKGLPESLARIIERHVGAGITEEEAKKIGLPSGNYVPETLEEKIVSYADKIIEGDRQIDIELTVEKFARELGVDHPALDRLKALHGEILDLIGQHF